MSETLGVGIIAFYGRAEVEAAVNSVREHAPANALLLVWDNSENDEVGEWLRHHAAEVSHVRSQYNAGCSRARNGIAEWFLRRSVQHFVIQDQDVVWTGDAASAMRAVFARYPDTGVASWHLFKRQMSPGYKPDDTGVVPEIPGACCMYSGECIRAVVKQARKDGCDACAAWNTRMIMYRFDTLFCLLAGKAGYRTRIVVPDADLVRHDHPHHGIKRNEHWQREQAKSRAIFAEEVKRHGLHVPVGL